MAELVYPTSFSDEGPWLISEEALRSLDTVLDEEWDRLTRDREGEISALVETELQNMKKGDKQSSQVELDAQRKEIRENLLRRNYKLQPNSRSIKIKFVGGKYLHVTSFAEAMRDQAIDGEGARGPSRAT